VLFRLLFLIISLLTNLYACKGGYNSCISKVKDSYTIQNNSIAIPLKNQRRLLYRTSKPSGEVLKSDPFLGLYLIKDKTPFAYPFDFNMRLQLGTAMVTDYCSREGKFVEDQIGLNKLARYSEALLYPSILTSSCCSLEGIVTSRGIIQKEYLYRFLHSKTSLYGDIGIRIKDDHKAVIVDQIDPFMKNNPFLRYDQIIRFDKKKVKNAANLMQQILFSPLGSKHSVELIRLKKKVSFFVQIRKRYGGGLLSDTFLESKGLYFDRRLKLIKITATFKNYGLKLGDKLIQVNGTLVKNQKELREYLQKSKDYSSLLFERDGFQFFVNIK